MVAKIRRKRNKKTNKKPFLFYILLTIIFLSLAVFLAYTNFEVYQRRSKLKAKITSLKQELEKLEETNKILRENVNYIESEDYLERAAREELEMKKPGEEVVVIQKEEDQEEEKDKNWWGKLKGIFMRD